MSNDVGSPIDRDRLAELIARERETFGREHPRSRELHTQARRSLLGGVPMAMMMFWPGDYPVFVAEARGSHLTDVDGNTYVDLCLGDTGAMSGHAPEPVLRAMREFGETKGGFTTMLPSEDAIVVADELSRRFGAYVWQFTVSASDANRCVLRFCRHLTRRPYVLVYSWCYHGSVDEVVIVVDQEGHARSKPGNVGPAVDPVKTTKVVEFNDVAALARALAPRDVACVLMEPAMTNIGIVPPLPGYLEEVRRLCDKTGTPLINDETHTWSAGPGGCTRAWGLHPDIVTLGKTLASGIPVGAYGLSADLAEGILGAQDVDLSGSGGFGGTLAGYAFASAAAHATLTEVLTDEAFKGMIALADRLAEQVQAVIEAHELPWCVTRLGARVEYRFCPQVPRNGGESHAANDPELERYFHLGCLNRGILITPFHNMQLVCPATSPEDVDRHGAVFEELVDDLVASTPTL